jgi:hypothetical protein
MPGVGLLGIGAGFATLRFVGGTQTYTQKNKPPLSLTKTYELKLVIIFQAKLGQGFSSNQPFLLRDFVRV